MTVALVKAAAADLKSYIERVERIAQERRDMGDEIRAILAEAKAAGFDTKAIRSIVKRRDKDASELAEEESILASYMQAIGMAVDTPLHLQVARLAKDDLSRAQVIDAIQQLIPVNGEAILSIGGEPMRLWRTEDGKALAEAYAPPLFDQFMKKRGDQK